jgi:hypothetical protein
MKNALLVLALYTVPTFADQRVGNGGDAVVCRNVTGEINSVELLDYYEARKFYYVDLDFPTSSDDPMTIVRSVLSRFKGTDEFKADKYLRRAEEFFSLVGWHDGYLEDIPDDLGLGYDHNCKLEQLVIRNPRADHNRRLKLFLIRKDLFDRMSPQNQAGVVLHEIIYEDFMMNLGEKNSINARNFHIYVASTLFVDIDLQEYLEFMAKDLRLTKFEFSHDGECYFGNPVEAWKADRPAEMNSCTGRLSFLAPLWVENATFELTKEFVKSMLRFSGLVTLTQYGIETRFELAEGGKIHSAHIKTNPTTGMIVEFKMDFLGCLKSTKLGTEAGIMVSKEHCRNGTEHPKFSTTFHSNGIVSTTDLQFVHSLWEDCTAQGVPEFSDNGALIGYRFFFCVNNSNIRWFNVTFWPGTTSIQSGTPSESITFEVPAGTFTLDLKKLNDGRQYEKKMTFWANGMPQLAVGYLKGPIVLRGEDGIEYPIEDCQIYIRFNENGYVTSTQPHQRYNGYQVIECGR